MTAVSKAASSYNTLLGEIKERIRSAQYEALKAVNRELVALYWDIGCIIVERQKDEGWGKAVVQRLATDLQEEFPGVQGFSAQNLWYMRQLFLEYSGKPKLQPLVGEISWSKNLVVMAHCKDDLEREFYIRMTKKFGWSKSVLIHHIENQSYEKTLLGQTNFDKTLPENIRAQAKLAVKDEYTFDFLELGEEHSERDLERALIGKVEHFLKEMPCGYRVEDHRVPARTRGEDAVLPRCPRRPGSTARRESLGWDYSLQDQRPHHCGICLEVCGQANWRFRVSHSEETAESVEGATADTGAN
jgi:predicted nuclease of restriction endonuclease-like (RecB) superfamily